MSTDTVFRVRLPGKTIDAYQADADRLGKSLEYVLIDRLTACRGHTSSRPLYIDDDQRRRLEKLLGKNFLSPDKLIAAIEQCVTLSVADCDIELPATLLPRLKSRCFGGQSLKEVVSREVVLALERFVGLR